MYTKAKQWVVSFYVADKWLCDEDVLGRDLQHACKMAVYIYGTVLRQHGIDAAGSVQVSWRIRAAAGNEIVNNSRVNCGAATVSLKGGA